MGSDQLGIWLGSRCWSGGVNIGPVGPYTTKPSATHGSHSVSDWRNDRRSAGLWFVWTGLWSWNWALGLSNRIISGICDRWCSARYDLRNTNEVKHTCREQFKASYAIRRGPRLLPAVGLGLYGAVDEAVLVGADVPEWDRVPERDLRRVLKCAVAVGTRGLREQPALRGQAAIEFGIVWIGSRRGSSASCARKTPISPSPNGQRSLRSAVTFPPLKSASQIRD